MKPVQCYQSEGSQEAEEPTQHTGTNTQPGLNEQRETHALVLVRTGYSFLIIMKCTRRNNTIQLM